MAYKVSFYFGMELDSVPTRYMNRTQAINGMHKLAYDTLAAFGKLDTAAAHTVMSDITKCNDILPPQDERYVRISNTGYSLIIRNTARSNR
jgi:hypothetical protein